MIMQDIYIFAFTLVHDLGLVPQPKWTLMEALSFSDDLA